MPIAMNKGFPYMLGGVGGVTYTINWAPTYEIDLEPIDYVYEIDLVEE